MSEADSGKMEEEGQGAKNDEKTSSPSGEGEGKTSTTSTTSTSSSSDDDDDKTPKQFSQTAMGLGLATTTKAVLTPVVGMGLMGVAATDALTTGTTGAYHRAGDLIHKTNKADVDMDQSRRVGKMEYQAQLNQSVTTIPKDRLEPMRVDVYDPDTVDYRMLRKDYVDKGIPFVLRKPNGELISDAKPPKEDDGSGEVGSIAVLSDSMKAKYNGIDEIIKKLLPRTYRAYWPLWFQGNYKSGLAHVDLGPGTCNFYFLRRGKKDVVIAPFETTRKLVMKTGIDNLYVPGSSGNHEYLSTLDKYYRLVIEEQSILVFNNSGCLHHFTNIIDETNDKPPIALSVRCKHAYGSDPRGWLNLAGNVKVWWNMTDHLMALRGGDFDSRKQEKA